ncbi:DinB family protein [Planifilum fimeticola]|uniref:DinB family protein n=1 Tax=Planifilum fimeticola TaxID=201975 RepID=UPI000D05783E
MKVSDAIEKIRRDLVDTLEQLDRWFDLPAGSLTYKPRDGGWSIREVLEHITLTNHFLMIIIRKGKSAEAVRTRKSSPRGNRPGSSGIHCTTGCFFLGSSRTHGADGKRTC